MWISVGLPDFFTADRCCMPIIHTYTCTRADTFRRERRYICVVLLVVQCRQRFYVDAWTKALPCIEAPLRRVVGRGWPLQKWFTACCVGKLDDSPDWWWRGQACFSRLCAKAGRHLCTPPPPPLCKTRRRPRLKKHDYGQSEEGCSSPTKATRTREKREEGEVEVWQPRATLSRGRPAGLEPWRHTRFLFRRAKVKVLKVFLFAVQGSPTRRKTPTKATRRARADQEGAWVRPVVPSQTSTTPSASRHPHADNRAEL